jgi:DCN1-like protein 1/2
VEAIDAYLSEESSSETATTFPIKVEPKLVEIFDKFADPSDPQKIDINGTMNYLASLKIEPEHPKALFLAYLLNSPSVGVFERQSFLSQWALVKCTSLKQMTTYIDTFYDDIIAGKSTVVINQRRASFQNLYNFTFGFLMELQNQKLLDVELAIDYWKLLFPLIIDDNTVLKRLDQWYGFVQTVHKRSFSKDSWSMFYLFVEDIMKSDPVAFSQYDEMASWPSVIDEFIEYLRENDLLAEKM